MHDKEDPTSASADSTTIGRHRERPDSVSVGCFIKVFPHKLGLRVHTPHDGSQNSAVAS